VLAAAADAVRSRGRVPRTQIKAITYSAMQIHEREGHAEVYVIVDI
jgi:SHS2 domain-containing protein